jgi:hypothetical protein
MQLSAFQDHQQLERAGSMSVKRASRGSAAPGSSLFAATLARTVERPMSYDIYCSNMRRSGTSGLICAHSSKCVSVKQHSCNSGLIYGPGSGSRQIQMHNRLSPMPARITKLVLCHGITLLPPTTLANRSFNRTNTGMLRIPAFAG